MRLGAAVKRAAMISENNSNIERHEIESDFRNFGQYNKYIFEESIRPLEVHMKENNLTHAKTPPQINSPTSPKPVTLGTVLNQSRLSNSNMHVDMSDINRNMSNVGP